MNKTKAYIKGSFLFGAVGTALGSAVSYLVTYWGGHWGMLQGLLEPQARQAAAGILLSNFLFGVGFAAVPALIAGVGASSIVHLLGHRIWRWSFALICALLGAGLSFIVVGPNDMLGSPVVSGAVAAFATALLLWERLCKFFAKSTSAST